MEKNIQNRSDGDYYPKSSVIKPFLVDMYEPFEGEYRFTHFDNDLVEQKTEKISTVYKYGNIFVETDSIYEIGKGWVKSGFSITKSGHQFRAFYDDKNEKLLPFAFLFVSPYLQQVIETGMECNMVQHITIGPLNTTGHYTKGYVVPFVWLFKEFILNTPDIVFKQILIEREKHLENKEKQGEMERNNRLKELANGNN